MIQCYQLLKYHKIIVDLPKIFGIIKLGNSPGGNYMERKLSKNEIAKLNTAINLLDNMVHPYVEFVSTDEYDSYINLQHDHSSLTVVISNETIIAAENGADLAKKIMIEYFEYFLILS